MEKVKVVFTNRDGQTSVVEMPVNQFVIAAELKPDQYRIFKGDSTAEDYVDYELIVKNFLNTEVIVDKSEMDLTLPQKVASLDNAVGELLNNYNDLREEVDSIFKNQDPLADDFNQLKKDFEDLRAKIQPVG